MIGKTWKSRNLIRNTDSFLHVRSTLSNYHKCDNRTSKRPAIENKEAKYVACACDHMSFLNRLDM